MAEPARKGLTVADFLDWDDGTDIRYELVRGEVVAMVSSLMGHGDLVAAITIAIGRRLTRPSRPIDNAGIVPPMRDDTHYLADIAVTCEPHDPSRRYLQEPNVIIEVLSPSTAAEDFDFKLPDYRLVPTVNEIAFFSAREKRADIWRREDAGWHVDDLRNSGEINFPSIGVKFPIEEVYVFLDQRG